MYLSVLICTLPKRKAMFYNLLQNLEAQIRSNKFVDEVEILSMDDVDMTTGHKRNLLLEKAQGDFIVFIDDDDEVDLSYLELIVNCIKNNPHIDCIGIKGIISFDGGKIKPWSISIKHKHWHETPHEYFRTPNHISPVKREIAVEAKFPNITYGEDLEYSKRIFPMLKSEATIDKAIYHYKYISNK